MDRYYKNLDIMVSKIYATLLEHTPRWKTTS